MIWKHGKTNAQYYILPRRYYELTGDLATYSIMTDWGIEQVWAVILPFLQKYGKAKRSDFVTLVGNHLSDKQLRKIIDDLRASKMLKTEGERRQMVYMLGDAYKMGADIMNKALQIGLNALKENGEI